jgi:hypothetical protein
MVPGDLSTIAAKIEKVAKWGERTFCDISQNSQSQICEPVVLLSRKRYVTSFRNVFDSHDDTLHLSLLKYLRRRANSITDKAFSAWMGIEVRFDVNFNYEDLEVY